MSPVYDFLCRHCGYEDKDVKLPAHKRVRICPKCKRPLPPRISPNPRRWAGGTPN